MYGMQACITHVFESHSKGLENHLERPGGQEALHVCCVPHFCLTIKWLQMDTGKAVNSQTCVLTLFLCSHPLSGELGRN